VTTPSGESIEVPLDRISPNTFGAEIPLLQDAAGEPTVSGTALTARSYSAEYEPGEADTEQLQRIANSTGGRVGIASAMAFDTENLTPGTSWFSLVPWLVLLAALMWPLAVALSRIALRGRDAVFAREEQAADRNAALQVRRQAKHVQDQAKRDDAQPGAAPVPGRSRQPAPDSPDSGRSASPETGPATPAPPHSPSPLPQPLPKATDDPADGATSTLDALLARKRRNADDS